MRCRESKQADYFCGMALEACVAWEGLHRGRRVGEVARRGPGASSRVGKNEILVKRRGVPDGLFQGEPADLCGWPPGGSGRPSSAVAAAGGTCLGACGRAPGGLPTLEL